MAFFELSLVNCNLEDYYRTNVVLKIEYGFSFSELEDMIPFERDVIIHLIIKRNEEKRKNRGIS